MRKVIFILVLATVGFGLASCSKYQQLLKSENTAEKYEAAVEYYEEEDYYRALPLFEELLTIFRGTTKAEKVFYYYAYCHYGMGDYITGGHHFRTFTKTFANSEHAEEAMYMGAYCYYLQSPMTSLDQGNTTMAINQLQLFINKYPESGRVTECNKLIDDLRDKLQKKAFDNAYLYYKTENYKSAVIALKNSVKEYPGTKYEEETLFLAFKSGYLYAANSIYNKQEERYKEALEDYRTFAKLYPDSRYMKEAKELEEEVNKALAKRKEKQEGS